MEDTRWGLEMISVKSEMAEESFDGEFEMQRWEPLVKQEQPPADSEPSGASNGQLTPDTPLKYEAEEWGRDSDSGIVEESPSEFISSTLLKEEEAELESDSGISEENTAQVSARPGHVHNPHEIFLEEEIEWHFAEDPASSRDPLSTEEERQEAALAAAVEEDERRGDGDAAHGGEEQCEDFQTKGGSRPPPYWGPQPLAGPPPPPPPPELSARPPPPDYWDRRAHVLPRSHHCALCQRWFTSLPHLRRHYASALHQSNARLKGLPVEPAPARRQRRSWKALVAAGSVSVVGPSDATSPPQPPSPPQRLPPPPQQLPSPQPLPPQPLLSDVTNFSPLQVCPTTPQLPKIPQPPPEGCRAPTCGLQPFSPYKWQQHATPGLSESQLWAADGADSGLALQRMGQQHWQQFLQQQQERDLYLQHQKQQQQQQQQQRERQRDLYQQQQQQRERQRDLYLQQQPVSASAPTSAVTVRGTVGSTTPSSSTRDTTYTHGRRDAFQIMSQTVPKKEPQDSATCSQQHSVASLVPATRSAPAVASPRGSRAVALSQDIEQLQWQYHGVTILAAKPKPPSQPPPAAPVRATADPVTATAAPSAESGHRCPVCSVSFARDSELRLHVQQLHSGDVYFRCEQCGAKFAGRANYCAHVAGQCPGRPFSCDECPKRFTNRAHLARHKMLHSGERPYVCHVCSKGFIRKDHLLKHAKVHDCRCAFCVPRARRRSVPQ